MPTMSVPQKLCPRCHTPAQLQAAFCAQCGHVYRTKFAEDRTQIVTQDPPTQVIPVASPPPGQALAPMQPPYPPAGQFPAQHLQPPYQQPYPPQYQQPPYYAPLRPDVLQVPPGTHSPVWAVLLSLLCLVVGGQLYNRQYVKAVVILAVALIGGAVTGGAFTLLTWIVCPIDAGCIASRLNRGEPVGQWQFF